MFLCNLLAIDTRIFVGCARNAHHSNDNDQGQQKTHSAVITAQNGRFMKPCVIIYIHCSYHVVHYNTTGNLIDSQKSLN